MLEADTNKNSIYKKFIKNKNRDNLANFKKHRNYITDILHKKASYFHRLFSTKNVNGTDKMWKNINHV